MLQFALLGMEAAGMVFDWFGNQNQIELGRMGAQVQQAGIDANIELTRAQAEQATLASMQKLRQTLGSQIAVQAARGNAMTSGTAASLFNESISTFNQDKKAIQLNQLSKEAELRANGIMAQLHQKESEMSLSNSFRNKIIDKIPTNPDTIRTGWSNFKNEISSFGMTSI